MLRPALLNLHCISKSGSRKCYRTQSGRHPDYIKLRENPLQPVDVKDRHNLEADVRYRRVDYSAELASEARLEFARCLAAGEANIPLARAALLIAAEDDAIASSSTVRFPVDAFLDRVTQVAVDTAHALSVAASATAVGPAGEQHQQPDPADSSSSSRAQPGPEQQWAALRHMHPEQVTAAVEHVLFKQLDAQQQQQSRPQKQWNHQQQTRQWHTSAPVQLGFCMPKYGRSNLPHKTLVDHPGVWEDARLAYLNEVLVKRRGCAAALVILYAEVMQQLLLMGAIDFAVTFEYNDFNSLPHATPLLNLGLQNIMQPAAEQQTLNSSASSSRTLLLNTCSSDALAEVLRHLKRSYWPFPWDTNLDDPAVGGQASLGGFRGAAKAALGSADISAALRAVSATAQHRLQRGIWTSPGAGDLVRCVAAAERLVMMVGDEQPAERRDLAVLLLHAGQPSAAAAELAAYLDTVKSSRMNADPFDIKLANDLWRLIRQDSGIKPDSDVMSVDRVLKRGVVSNSEDDEAAFKPLTW